MQNSWLNFKKSTSASQCDSQAGTQVFAPHSVNCSSSVQFECAATEICLILLCQLTNYFFHNVWSICLVRARLSFHWGGHLDWGDFGDVESSCASSKFTLQSQRRGNSFRRVKTYCPSLISRLLSTQHSPLYCYPLIWRDMLSSANQLSWSAVVGPIIGRAVHLSPISAPHRIHCSLFSVCP